MNIPLAFLPFLVMVPAGLVPIHLPDIRPPVGILATVAALRGAAKLTGWYPDRLRNGAIR